MTDTLRDELVTLTTDLIRFHSTADQPEQLGAVIDYVAHYLAQIPGLFIHRSERNNKPAIVATLHETRTPTLLLNGHLDVVAARPEQFVPQVRDGRIYGRGSQDMKGSVAVLMRLLRNLATWESRPNIGVQFVSDEEIGGEDGTGRLIAEGWRCAFFIAAEPTDMDICYEQKGGVWMELRLDGIPAHASRPWNGKNPLFALSAGLEALAQRFPPLESESWRTTATPTRLGAADNAPNQISPYVLLTLDIRHTAEDTPDDLVAAVQASFPTAHITTCKFVSPLINRPDEPAIMSLAEVSSRIRARLTRIYREHFASDARFYSVAGIPAVCFGPVGFGLHSDEEWVEINSLVQFYQVLRTYIQHM